MRIQELFHEVDLHNAVADGWVRQVSHESAPLTLYNYTAKTQHEGHWDNITRACRGLILGHGGQIVARPWPKFLNLSQHESHEIPAGLPRVSEKMDGSLGVGYRVGSEVRIATRGSFTSDQAIWANEWLHAHYPDLEVPDGLTPLWEIIYPENRIVVHYHYSGLVLLGATHIRSGADVPIEECDWWAGSRAGQYDHLSTPDDILAFVESPQRRHLEGVVLSWPSERGPDFKVKVKSGEYVRLHAILTNVSAKTVWRHVGVEALRPWIKGPATIAKALGMSPAAAASMLESPDAMATLLESVPDEFALWVKTIREDLEDRAESELNRVWLEFQTALLDTRYRQGLRDHAGRHLLRGQFAAHVSSHPDRSMLFTLLDQGDIRPAIWRALEPPADLPFQEPDV